jgi:23S rRNA U2552 (ribose-2'-O)-methylase RlmE/FtsJ
MNDLYSFFVQRRNTRPMHRWHHYFEVYERLFAPLRNANATVLEIGVQGGGSLEMWRSYFGDGARIYGIDVDPGAKRNEDIATRVFIGDQADRNFLREVRRQIGRADIIIDDGGHLASQQITSFEELYSMLSETGFYVVEDTHTAVWGGRYNDRQDGQNILSFAINCCAKLMEWSGRPEYFQQLMTDQNVLLADKASEFCRTTKSISFYDSLVIFERGRRAPPRHDQI